MMAHMRMKNSHFSTEHEVDILCAKIAQVHFAYLTEEETPSKIEHCQRIEDYIFDFLFLVPHKRKFKSPAFAEILQRSVDNQGFTAYKAVFAFNFIEKYASNLICQPWRKEYRVVNMFGGFYKHNIGTILPSAHVIFTLMGYKRNREKETLTLSGPVDPDKLSRASLDCLVASLECRIMTEIAESLKGVPWSWQEIYQVRKENICDVRMAVEIIRSIKAGPLALPVPHSYGHNFTVNDCGINRLHKKSSTRTTNDLINLSINEGVSDNLIVHPAQNKLIPHKSNSSAFVKESPDMLPMKSSVPIDSQKKSDRVMVENRHSQEHEHPKKSTATVNNVIQSNSLSNHNIKPFEDRSVRPKVRKLPEKVEEPTNNRVSASRMADLSWDYVYQVLEKKGYNKDLGERGDLLGNKTKTLPSSKDRAAKTLSMPNRHLDTALKPSKDDDEAVWKADMFNSLQIPKTKDEPMYSSSKLQNREVHSADNIKYEKPIVKSVKTGTSPKLIKMETSNKKKLSPLLAKKKIEVIVNNERKENPDISSSDLWSCSFCTFLNKNSVVCEMCSRSKERGPEVQPLVSGGRECPSCTLVNERDAGHCSACNTCLEDSPTYI